MTHDLLKAVTGIALGAAVLLTGCGPSTCDRAEAASTALQQKKGNCDVTVTSASGATCEANVSNCSADDQEKLVAMFDCIEDLPVCQAGNEAGWFASLGACSSHLENVSENCRKAAQNQ